MNGGVTETEGSIARRLLVEAREELVRADTKAATLLAAFGIIVGVVLAGIVAGDWSPNRLTLAAAIGWWGGAASIGAALGLLGFAIYPRITKPVDEGPVTYFGDVARLPDVQALRDALARQVERVDGRDIEQLKVISDIAMTKYRGVQAALGLFGAGTTACFIAAIVG